MPSGFLNLLIACLSHFPQPWHNFLLKLIPLLSKFLTHQLSSVLTLSCLMLVNSGTNFLHLYFHLPTTWSLVSRVGDQDISPPEINLSFGHSSLLLWESWVVCSICVMISFLLLLNCFLYVLLKKKVSIFGSMLSQFFFTCTTGSWLWRG